MMRSFFLWIKRLSALGVAIILLAWITDAWIMPTLTRHQHETQTPDVTGMVRGAAELLLEEKGFQALIEREKADPTGQFRSGQIMEQFPRAGQLTKEGRRVYLTVCSGGRHVHLPDLKGVTFRRYQTVLADLGLHVDSTQVAFVFDPRLARGTLVDQLPQAGDSLLPGTSVGAVVSLGQERATLEVPDVIGLELEQAEWLIRSAGLKRGLLSFRESANRLGILEQTPVSGQWVSPGSPVKLWIKPGETP
jgi:eukaryotic-like serine/threonine-protein kinase